MNITLRKTRKGLYRCSIEYLEVAWPWWASSTRTSLLPYAPGVHNVYYAACQFLEPAALEALTCIQDPSSAAGTEV